MESVFETYLGQDGLLYNEPDDIPKTATTVWILGKSYNSVQELEIIRRDIRSRIWCTYRRGFAPLGTSKLTTDRGWGCMLRCGQMVLAQALIELHLGREWFWTKETRDRTYLKIVNRFEDFRNRPFSIHLIASMGDSAYKKIGEWFGPNTVAQVLKKLVEYDDWCSIAIHVAMDNVVVTEDIFNLCTKNSSKCWKPLLLIIPLRLGLSEINPIYVSALKKCFQLDESVGMIGGKPNQALYFIGYADDEAIYLDPHTTQRSGSVGDKSEEDEIDLDETYHQKYASRINFQQMDPSLAVCFLCKTKQSFDTLLEKFTNDINSGNQALFEISQTRPVPWTPLTKLTENKSVVQEDFVELAKCSKDKDDGSDEDFEIIT